MPLALSYPGVYIEEIKSGVRTITGVATSIAAFVGSAERGPVDDPITINNFGDFQRNFGGLSLKHMMSFSVKDFFLNGGSQAIIVRVSAKDAKPATLTTDGLVLEAASKGETGNSLHLTVDLTSDLQDKSLGKGKYFNITIYEGDSPATATQVEKFVGLLLDPASARFAQRVFEQESSLVRVVTMPTQVPATDAVRGVDAVAAVAATGTTPAVPAVPEVKAKPPTPKDFTQGSDGTGLLTSVEIIGNKDTKTGMFALEKADIFNLLCIPPFTASFDSPDVVADATRYCTDRRAMLLVDPPSTWKTPKDVLAGVDTLMNPRSTNAALFFPRLIEPNSLLDNQLQTFAPSGAVAGVFARTDATRGVWKAPAGIDATLAGVVDLSVHLTDEENGRLNPLAINCLRSFPVYGRVVWGSRTTKGADVLSDDYKYIPVRRLALYIEESLFRGSKWVVFEPNDEPLWAQVRLNFGAFMHNLFRQGAFQGTTPRDAYFVKCDKETTTQNDINLGIVNIVVGFAPLKPAEFVVIKLQQIAGQIDV